MIFIASDATELELSALIAPANMWNSKANSVGTGRLPTQFGPWSKGGSQRQNTLQMGCKWGLGACALRLAVGASRMSRKRVTRRHLARDRSSPCPSEWV